MMKNKATNEFTILFAGGGTGGHLMPGLSVAGELRNRFGGCRSIFVGTSNEIEQIIVERQGFEFHSIQTMKLPASALGTPGWAVRSVGGLIGAKRLISQIKPDIVVSLGGHGALAPSLAARLAGVPLVIMEQNTYPGKVNRLLSWWAREVYAPWPGIESHFAYPDRVSSTGNPVRHELKSPGNRKMAGNFGLSTRKKTLLVMGGSLGARSINEAIIESLPILERESEWLQILHSTGKNEFESVRAAYEKSSMPSAVLPFIDDMASAYAITSLAFCRAGGTTAAELTVQGVPSILVPLPWAANDHQRKNASYIASEGAAVLMDQSDLTPQRLARTVLNLIRNEPLLKRMRRAGIKLGRPAAAENVANRIHNIIQDNQWPEASISMEPSLIEGG